MFKTIEWVTCLIVVGAIVANVFYIIIGDAAGINTSNHVVMSSLILLLMITKKDK